MNGVKITFDNGGSMRDVSSLEFHQTNSRYDFKSTRRVNSRRHSVCVSTDFARITDDSWLDGKEKEPWELSVGFNAIRSRDGRRINQPPP